MCGKLLLYTLLFTTPAYQCSGWTLRPGVALKCVFPSLVRTFTLLNGLRDLVAPISPTSVESHSITLLTAKHLHVGIGEII